jgi:hypothetical protein
MMILEMTFLLVSLILVILMISSHINEFGISIMSQRRLKLALIKFSYVMAIATI